MPKERRALLSVFDKAGIEELGHGLTGLGFELLSTGGTFRRLSDNDIPVTRVSDATGFPEILGGRVKTLHPKIHGGILADRSEPAHAEQMAEHGIAPIDLVVVNLYPFRDAAAKPDAGDAEIIEMIDIGGPTMVRAAAKNHRSVLVVVDPADYGRVLSALESGDGTVPDELRVELALKAFRHTQSYDAAIATWFEQRLASDGDVPFPLHVSLELERDFAPRYGENPHQPAAVFRAVGGGGLLGGFNQLQGKELSFNNMLDADAARRLAARFERPVAAILKHNNPCGVGVGDSPAEAYERALACDPVSAFGSIIAVNRTADAALAEAMAGLFVEVVLAPDYEPAALEIFARKKNLRVLRCPIEPANGPDMRAIDGGFLFQAADSEADRLDDWQCVTERQPTEVESQALALGWKVARDVKSNAIVVANSVQTVGIGAGQMSRVDSCRIAVDKAELPLKGAAAASDAFFPFPDGLEALADAGITAVIQPGGSKRDPEVIAAANERGVAMIFTGRRHFRH
jgi:phosphoribosylaminoimidazolecarboxamide formyltransferase/IMP cyclohydrolase